MGPIALIKLLRTADVLKKEFSMGSLTNALKHWRSTTAGILTLAAVAYHVYQVPAALTDSATLAGITAGFGLIVSADAANASLDKLAGSVLEQTQKTKE